MVRSGLRDRSFSEYELTERLIGADHVKCPRRHHSSVESTGLQTIAACSHQGRANAYRESNAPCNSCTDFESLGRHDGRLSEPSTVRSQSIPRPSSTVLLENVALLKAKFDGHWKLGSATAVPGALRTTGRMRNPDVARKMT